MVAAVAGASPGERPVSYTHLDVYKRQCCRCCHVPSGFPDHGVPDSESSYRLHGTMSSHRNKGQYHH